MNKKTKIIILFLTLIFGLEKIRAQNWIWAIDEQGYMSSDICADYKGYVYTTGYFNSTAKFGSKFLVGNLEDIFLCKYDSTGNLIWVEQAGSNGHDDGLGIAVDTSGNIYMTGRFSNSCTFGTTTLNSNGNYDMFTAKYNQNGIPIWVKQGGGSGIDEGYRIQVDKQGNVYVIGVFTNSATFGNTTLNSNGSEDIFIIKYDPFGNINWVKQIGGTDMDFGFDINIDYQNNILITGNFKGSISFNTNTLTSVGDWDVFIAKLDSLGNIIWVKQAGGSSEDNSYGIGTDTLGNVYATGYFTNNISFGTINISGTNATDGFICKYDKNGNIVWGNKVNNVPKCHDLTVDNSGNIYVTSWITNDLIIKYNNQGNLIWSKKPINGTSIMNQGIYSSGKNIYSTGQYSGTWMFNQDILLSTTGNIYLSKFDTSYNSLSTNERYYEDESIFKIYPNPANDHLSILYSGTDNEISLSIYDCIGQLIYKQNIKNENETIINTSQLKTGTYILKANSVTDNLIRKLIIK